MGRHKWEMNNTYEHTTLAQFTEWMGTEHTTLGVFDFPTGNLGFGQLIFTNIFEDMDSRMLFLLAI